MKCDYSIGYYSVGYLYTRKWLSDNFALSVAAEVVVLLVVVMMLIFPLEKLLHVLVLMPIAIRVPNNNMLKKCRVFVPSFRTAVALYRLKADCC